MSTIDSNVHAVQRVRDAIPVWVDEQKEIIRFVRHELQETLARLDQQERRAELDFEHYERELDECLERDAYLAQIGGGVDCSPWYEALDEARHRLAVAQSWIARVEAAEEQHRAFEEQLLRYVDFELPRGMTYLDDLIEALETVLRTRSAES